MGEVYRARDVRLDRSVAVKILPAELSGDAHYRQRFEREARAASALSHPHIAHVYDVGEQDGTHFIAMEYVEGENLRELVTRGPLDVDRVVEIGAQMASALEEAHGRGVVHRDVKSANAVVTPKGQVKVLDFGLARRDRDGAGPLDSEQVTEARTQAGVVVGTVPYMSPEQAMGKDLDARTDLFSLGVVLYELATGRLPFVGNTATQTIDQICHATPVELGASRKGVPAELERIVRKCLEKDRERRYASARDLVVDLRNLQRDRATGTGPVAVAPRRGSRRLLVLGAAFSSRPSRWERAPLRRERAAARSGPWPCCRSRTPPATPGTST
jgi:serine/threonine protein kinase